MRFKKFLKEDVVKQALNIEEPKVGRKYSEDLIDKRVKQIQKALDSINIKDRHTEAMAADLEDKLDKWSNVEKETQAPKPPPTEAPPEGEGKGAEEEQDQDQADKEAEEKEKEKEEADKEKEKEEADKEKEKEAEEREKEKEQKRKENAKMRGESRLIKSKIRLKR
jgi:hypothetical protein